MAYMSNMKFEINPDAITSGLISGEIIARLDCQSRSKEQRQKLMQHYIDNKIINSAPSVNEFIKNNPQVFRNRKLIGVTGNIFEEFVTLSPLSNNEDYDEKLKNRMVIGHDLTLEEMEGMDDFLREFHELSQKPDVQEKIQETRSYKRSVEKLWNGSEKSILTHIKDILGYEPENLGKVSTFMMYPNYDTHRSCQVAGNKTFLFLGKRGEDTGNKLLAHLAHQAVHQPMLPYKISMSQKEKNKFHCFIKFLTDKEIYSMLSGESQLKISTPKEDCELMGKVYPYWLGYKYRNVSKQGLDPEKEIAKTIKQDKAYYDSLPEDSRKKKKLSSYNFSKLDPIKIAGFFRYKKVISPYEFAKLDFDNRDFVFKEMSKKEEKTK